MIEYKACVITISTRAYKKEYEDESGEVLVNLLRDFGFKNIDKIIVSDDKKMLKRALIKRTKSKNRAELILTTGGTGLSRDDITPDVCEKLARKSIPGISEAIRAKSFLKTKNTLLSRAGAYVIKNSLVINMPGSPSGCRDSFEIIKDILLHALGLINGIKMDK